MIPTISRPTLARTLASLRVQPWGPGDEILLVGDGSQPQAQELWQQFGLPGRYFEIPGPNRDWGHTPRNILMDRREARGDYLAALDDDDEWPPGALESIHRAATASPQRPLLFRMLGAPVIGTVWRVRELCEGNVGTPMLVVPHDPARLGRYALRYGGDFDFIRDTCRHYPSGPVWCEEVIARIRPPF